jgi:mannose-6-phosphate isomerase-like protein (cupin superfamily)
VTCGELVKTVPTNGSVDIPVGEIHRLENRGKIPLHIIEAQVGDYLGEDDITRYEDNYGRS